MKRVRVTVFLLIAIVACFVFIFFKKQPPTPSVFKMPEIDQAISETETSTTSLVIRPSPPPDAAKITRSTMKGINNFLKALEKLDGSHSAFLNPNEDSCPLFNKDLKPTPTDLGLAPTSTVPRLPVSFAGFDPLFDKYGSCLPVSSGPHLLKAIAYVESRFDSSARSSEAFQGLFQIKPSICHDALSKYGFSDLCIDFLNTEVNTMVGAAIGIGSSGILKKKCPNATSTSIAAFIYLGHHNGRGALSNVLRHTCDYRELCPVIFEFWNAHGNGRHHTDTPVEEVCKDF